MIGTWRLPRNYIEITIVHSTRLDRYRISYKGRDSLVQIRFDNKTIGLLSGTTIDVTAKRIRMRPNGKPRGYSLSGQYEHLD